MRIEEHSKLSKIIIMHNKKKYLFCCSREKTAKYQGHRIYKQKIIRTRKPMFFF